MKRVEFLARIVQRNITAELNALANVGVDRMSKILTAIQGLTAFLGDNITVTTFPKNLQNLIFTGYEECVEQWECLCNETEDKNKKATYQHRIENIEKFVNDLTRVFNNEIFAKYTQ